ncbi:hypothetical protein AB0I39_29725 [Kitasatospora purpeofusca]|uniref:hypothetical protein n=1 Tax=Kitasatospora purpeofusca TaxID=67352 RepID=UPI0033C65362
MRDSFSDGFLSRLAHEAHPMDLMCRYLLHGSVERIPGLPADREALSFEHLSRNVRPENRSRYDDADTFSLGVRRKVRGRLYGLEFRLHFVAGEPYADAVVPFGAPVDPLRLVRRLRARYGRSQAPGDWDFELYTDARDLRESALLFGNGREVWFQVNRGPVVAGRSRPLPGTRGRLVTGRLHGNLFGGGTSTRPHAGGLMFPDRLAAVVGGSAEARAFRRYTAGLRGPLPRPTGRPFRPDLRPGPGPGPGLGTGTGTGTHVRPDATGRT